VTFSTHNGVRSKQQAFMGTFHNGEGVTGDSVERMNPKDI